MAVQAESLGIVRVGARADGRSNSGAPQRLPPARWCPSSSSFESAPPAQPQMWIAHNASITTTGTMPGLDQGTVELTLSYDYEQKME